MIKVSIGLPVFNSKKIAWLAIESLVNQKNIDFEWELLIAEEQEKEYNPVGMEWFFKNARRLKRVGCRDIRYLPLYERTALSQKWRLIAETSNPASELFLLQAADCYSQPYRLRETYDLYRQGNYDWIQTQRGIYYDINIDKELFFDISSITYPTALNMALKTSFVRNLPKEDVWQGVDAWIYRNCVRMKGEALNVGWNRSESWKLGVDTNGFNNISMKRINYFIDPKFPFHPTEMKIDDLIPKRFVRKLRKLPFQR